MPVMSRDILKLRDRITLAVQLGESHFREFKSALEGPPGKKAARDARDIARDIAETLVAFANADGGELLVGVEDDGSITGVHCTQEQIERLLLAGKKNVHSDTPLPSGRAVRVSIGNQEVLYFSVPKGSEFVYLTADGRCLQRKDRESVPISAETIVLSRTEVASREYDRQFVDNATVDDLNLELVQETADQISRGMSPEKCLQHLELAEFDGERFRLRRAALLLFARDVAKWHPRSQVRVLRIDGLELKSGSEYNVTSDQEVSSNILSLVEKSWDLIRPHLTETRFSAEALFKTQIIYPEAACREALINAIAHRDYSVEGRGIEVQVYTDRLDLVSPGGLLSSIRLEDIRQLKGVHQSRNALIARVLREVGYMRELGEGMRRIHELMQANDLAPPELTSSRNTFTITLRHQFIYSREEKLWLDNFERFNLSREQKTVVRLGYGGHRISAAEIWSAVGIVDTDAYRRLVESLRNLGILAAAVSRDQVARLADKSGVSRKSIPRYAVVLPSAAQRAAREPARAPESTPSDTSEYAKVFVTNIPFEVTEGELATAFASFGEVVDVQIPINAATKRNRGFAFVEFEKTGDAEAAVRSDLEVKFGGRKLVVQRYRPRRTPAAGVALR